MKMRRHLNIALIILIPLFAISCNNGVDPRELKFEAIQFNAPKTERIILKNGLTLHLLRDTELPLINIAAKVRSGSIYDPEGKEGLTSLTTTLMRSGGVKGISPEDIDRRLDFTGSKVELKTEAESINIVLSALKKDIGSSFNIFAKIIREPSFDRDKFTLERGRMIEAVKRENDKPEDTALRVLVKKIYQDRLLGGLPTIKSLNNIEIQDIKAFHCKYIRPENIIIGVAGDFEREDIIRRIESIFPASSLKSSTLPSIEKIENKGEKIIYLINKNIPQSVVRLGHQGLKKNSADNHAVRVMERILGKGGFTSRLVREIRTSRGLAYSVWGFYLTGHKTDGLFLAGFETKPETTGEALDIMLKTVDDMRENPVTDEELKIAKDSIINSFAFAFKGVDEVMQNRLNVEYYNLPSDYIEQFREKIDAVTKKDVLRVAQKYLLPEEMTIVVIGNKNRFDTPLSKFGKVEAIDLKG